jgi:hypothetical protein
MSDRGEIENLLYEYQARLDAGDLDAMAALFEHAVMNADTIDQSWRGSSEVLALFRREGFGDATVIGSMEAGAAKVVVG